MGSSNRVRVAYVAESVWGTTPTTPTLIEVRRTGGSLKSPTETVTSNEIRSDRNRATVQRVGVSANGSMEFELSYGSHDDLLAGAFASAWSTAIDFSGSVQITALTGTVAATGAFTNAVVGQWIKISGMTTAANNGYFKIATRASADSVTVEDPDDVLEDETDAAAAITSGGMLRNGTTETSFTIEQSHLDLAFYLQFLGMRVGGVNLSIPAGGLITGSFDFQGKEATSSAATIASVLTAANSNPVFNGTSHFSALAVDGAALTDDLTEISLALTNNLRQRRALGSLSPVGVPYGTADVTGSFRLYPAGKDLIDKYLAFDESSLSLRLVGGDGKSYILTVPKLVFTGDLPETGGLDGDVTLDLPWTAYYDSTLACSIQLDRFAS